MSLSKEELFDNLIHIPVKQLSLDEMDIIEAMTEKKKPVDMTPDEMHEILVRADEIEGS